MLDGERNVFTRLILGPLSVCFAPKCRDFIWRVRSFPFSLFRFLCPPETGMTRNVATEGYVSFPFHVVNHLHDNVYIQILQGLLQTFLLAICLFLLVLVKLCQRFTKIITIRSKSKKNTNKKINSTLSTIVPNILEQCTQAWVQLSQTLSTFYKTRSFAVCSVVKILLLSVENIYTALYLSTGIIRSIIEKAIWYNCFS